MPHPLPALLLRALRAAPALTLGLTLASPLLARAEPTTYAVDGPRSKLVVNVYRAGGFSHFLHDHHFMPGAMAGRVTYDREHPEATRVALTVQAASLKDHQPELNAKDEAKVNSQVAGPDVLDAAHHPTITFSADHLENVGRRQETSGPPTALTGTLVGTLTVRGVSKPIQVPVEATWKAGTLHATGKVDFKQSDFGIKPLHKGMGAIAVKDEVSIDFDIEALPEGGK